MADAEDDVLDHLRRFAPEVDLSDSDDRLMRARLAAVIAAEEEPVRRSPRAMPRRVLLALAVVAVSVVGVIALLRPSVVEATMNEFAQAARDASPLDVPLGGFVYQRLDVESIHVIPGSDLGLGRSSVAYVLPAQVERWWQFKEGFMQIVETVGAPRFFDGEVEQAYYDHGLDATDRVGERVLTRSTDVSNPFSVTEWPTTPVELRMSMERELAQGRDERPLDEKLFDLAGDIMATTVDPKVRGAILEVIAGLAVEIVERHPDGAVTIGITSDQPPRIRDTMTIARDGSLLETSMTWLDGYPDSGIPPGATSTVVYHLVSAVDELPDS